MGAPAKGKRPRKQENRIRMGFGKNLIRERLERGSPLVQKNLEQLVKVEDALEAEEAVGRNDPCPCGSGKKFKKCCLETE